jgi:excisionase family DNA binding protein
VTISPEDAELSTVRSAEVLTVSKPHLIKLLKVRSIPHRNVGKHRRIRTEDVIAQKATIDNEREAVLDQLAADPQERDIACGSK